MMRKLRRLICWLIGHKRVPFEVTVSQVDHPNREATSLVDFCCRCERRT